MKNVINKIFSGECDEEVHLDFMKFSKGKFENRYLMEGKKQAGKWSVKSSAEFGNYFVRRCLENFDGSVQVKGAIICTMKEIKKDIDFEISGEKGYMGIKQFLIDTFVSSEKILNLMDKYPRAFYALSFKNDNFELKIKPKAPKSGKPSNKEDDKGPKADFCSLKTSDKSVVDDLFFDFSDWKEIKIKHTIEVQEIELPSGVKEPTEMREKAVRKGVIIRKVEVDGCEEIKEKEFRA